MLTRLTRTATTLTLTAGMLAAAPIAQAQDIDFSEMTPEQTEAFGAQVRAYLMENPEVIMEAVAVLEERQAAGQARASPAIRARSVRASGPLAPGRNRSRKAASRASCWSGVKR